MSIVSRLKISVGLRTIVITGSTAAVVSVASALPSDASWAPKPEPKFWSEVRQQMMDQETSAPSDWTFMEAMQSPKIDAAEYLRDPRREESDGDLSGLVVDAQRGWQSLGNAAVIDARPVP